MVQLVLGVLFALWRLALLLLTSLAALNRLDRNLFTIGKDLDLGQKAFIATVLMHSTFNAKARPYDPEQLAAADEIIDAKDKLKDRLQLCRRQNKHPRPGGTPGRAASQLLVEGNVSNTKHKQELPTPQTLNNNNVTKAEIAPELQTIDQKPSMTLDNNLESDSPLSSPPKTFFDSGQEMTVGLELRRSAVLTGSCEALLPGNSVLSDGDNHSDHPIPSPRKPRGTDARPSRPKIRYKRSLSETGFKRVVSDGEIPQPERRQQPLQLQRTNSDNVDMRVLAKSRKSSVAEVDDLAFNKDRGQDRIQRKYGFGSYDENDLLQPNQDVPKSHPYRGDRAVPCCPLPDVGWNANLESIHVDEDKSISPQHRDR